MYEIGESMAKLRMPWRGCRVGVASWAAAGMTLGLVMAPGAEFDPDKFRAFLAEQSDLGPKQWPSFVRVGTNLPRTATFKVIKRQLSAEGLDCADPVWPIRR